jgi:thiamine-monophosphate kinase
MPAEFDFVDWLGRQQPTSPHVAVGVGDDLAVLRWDAGDLLLVGADQVLDGVHFDSAVHPPRLIGRKVMNRNLSDCAAMGCLPAAAVCTAALPKGTGLDYAKQLHLGMRDAADAFDCPIVGGDTASWSPSTGGRLHLSVTILARSAGIEPVLRGGARPGDGIYVTGPLGGSILGRHLTFTPRVREGRVLAKSSRVTAMIDLSDGLSRDLRHICQRSGVGALILGEQVPLHDDVRRLPPDSRSLLEHALHDGEDHELLLTAPAGLDQLADVPLWPVGMITQGPELLLKAGGKTLPLPARGWEHPL